MSSEFQQERIAAQAAAWDGAKKTIKAQLGCLLIPLILAGLALAYLAGLAAGLTPVCLTNSKPTHASTP